MDRIETKPNSVGNFYVNKHINKKFKNRQTGIKWTPCWCSWCSITGYCDRPEPDNWKQVASRKARRDLKRSIQCGIKYGLFNEEDDIMPNYSKQIITKLCKSKMVFNFEINLLFNFYLKYYKYEEIDDTFIVFCIKTKKKCFETENVSKLFNYLLKRNLIVFMADITLFINLKSFYFNYEWNEWLKKEIKYCKLLKSEQMKIIIKLHELINYYNWNLKYNRRIMRKQCIYYEPIKRQRIFKAFSSHIMRYFIKRIPIEIWNLCSQFYFGKFYFGQSYFNGVRGHSHDPWLEDASF